MAKNSSTERGDEWTLEIVDNGMISEFVTLICIVEGREFDSRLMNKPLD